MHRLIALVATLLLSASALAHAPRASVGALPFGEPTRIEQAEQQAEAAAPEPHALENSPRQQKTAHRVRARLKHAESARTSALAHCLVLENRYRPKNCASEKVVTAYTFDARDQVTTETPAVPTGPPIAYTHDANGNLTRRGPAASPLATYHYDSRDRLIRLTTGAQAPIESQYDEQDRRISRSDGATGSRYQWLGNHLIEELNSTNNRLTRYHRGVGLIGTTGQTSQPEPRQYALDALGTPLALIRTDGAVAGRTKFDAWGVVIDQTGEQSKLGHTGYQREVDDSYQAIARWYRPGIGRFMSMDPIDGDPLQPVTFNEYLAFNGNSTVYIDPDGRIAFLSDAEAYLRDTIQGYRASIDQATRDGAGGRAFMLGLGIGLVKAGNVVVGGLNTTSNLLAQNYYDGDTYAQARAELDANEMAVSGVIEGGHNLGRAVAADPLGTAEQARQASVRFTVDAAMGDPRALAGLGEFTGGVLGAPGGAVALRGSGRLASAADDLLAAARQAQRLDLEPMRLAEGADGNVVGRFDADMADDLSGIDMPAGRGMEIVDTRRAVEGLTQRAIADLANDPSIAKSLMTPGSYRHLVNRSALAPASYGKAVERLVARYIGQDWKLSRFLAHTGVTKGPSGRFIRSPDFVGKEAYDLRLIDITTEKDLAKHKARPSGEDTDHVVYPGLPPELEFPD